MLELKDIAKAFENGLNGQLEDKNIRFHIWANTGESTPPHRSGNDVTAFIDGTLRQTASKNMGTLIDMGAWTLELELNVPIPPPRTAAVPQEGSMNRIDDDQYAFLLSVAKAIDGYFSIAEHTTMTDASEKVYSVGIRTGSAIPGLSDIRFDIGESLPFKLYIELGYVENGINSRSEKVAFDVPENVMPTLSIETHRENVLESDVYTAELKRQSAASASAFGISLHLPLTKETDLFYDFIAEGKLNVAHFVYYELNGKQSVYWMIADSPEQSSTEVSNIGLAVNLIESVDDPEVIDVPDSYQVAYVEFDDTYGGETRPANVRHRNGGPSLYIHIGKKIYFINGSDSTSLRIEPDDYVYDEETGKYRLYFITPFAMDMIGWAQPIHTQPMNFKIAKEGKANG